jgi:hypothetical protein
MLALDYFNYKTPLRPSPLAKFAVYFSLTVSKEFFCIAKYISAKKLVNIREGAELQFT